MERVSRLLVEATGLVERMLEEQLSKAEILATYEDWTRKHLGAAGATSEQLADLADFNPPALSLAGILRYWKKRRGLAVSDNHR